MIELIHALITSLLLSTAAGCGVGVSTTTDEEPDNTSETGVDVGKLPAHLVSPRGQAPSQPDAGDDHQPTALSEQVAFCEPAIRTERAITPSARLPLAVPFVTAGRSP